MAADELSTLRDSIRRRAGDSVHIHLHDDLRTAGFQGTTEGIHFFLIHPFLVLTLPVTRKRVLSLSFCSNNHTKTYELCFKTSGQTYIYSYRRFLLLTFYVYSLQLCWLIKKLQDTITATITITLFGKSRLGLKSSNVLTDPTSTCYCSKSQLFTLTSALMTYQLLVTSLVFTESISMR